MDLERKTLQVAHFKTLDSAQGIAEMIVSVFNNVDAANERVLPGFFKDSLAAKLPKGVWMHDWMTPVAKSLEAKELLPGDALLPDSIKLLGGLYVKGQFNLGTQRGREAFSDLEFGTVDEFSIGYMVLEDRTDAKTGVRDLIKGTLYEWSPVLVGCNSATTLLTTKGTEMEKKPVAGLPIKIIGSDVEVKGQYLGAYIENRMTYSALSTLADALFYDIFYGVIYGSWTWDSLADEGDGDYVRSVMPVEEGVETLSGACDEFKELVLATYKALMAGSGDAAIAAAKSLRELFNNPELANKSLPAGEKFAVHSEKVLAAVQEFTTRAKSIQGLRVKEGRTLSEATRTRLKSHLDTLNSACKNIEEMLGETTTDDDTKSYVSEEEANAAFARFLEMEAKSLGVTV